MDTISVAKQNTECVRLDERSNVPEKSETFVKKTTCNNWEQSLTPDGWSHATLTSCRTVGALQVNHITGLVWFTFGDHDMITGRLSVSASLSQTYD
ncbi:hypothetical protein RRG08_064073 [Elysia crispata]|uniref:Uncharacterized protein n=1 Tax=Elysia crispata TaxID=231223 RepID=A0AAE0YES5_9GAST|nr:hypothetical protein RRG08_064073 [Elysia crispata]